MEKEKILIYLGNIFLVIAGFFIIAGLVNLNKSTYIICANDFDCYSKYFSLEVKNKGVEKTFVDIKSEYQKNPYISSHCHSITHIIGHAALSLYPNVSDAFNHGDSFCWSGYYHGVMEEISERIGKDGMKNELNNICSKINGKEIHSFNYFNCVHGLGHGVMSVNDNQIFDSLKMCDVLDGEYERQNCYGGVFMENVVLDQNGEHTDFLKLTDPMYPCNSVETKYKKPCYMMQPSYVLKIVQEDFSKAFDFCRNSEKGFEDLCFGGIGREAYGISGFKVNQTIQKCSFGKDEKEKQYCYNGAALSFVAYYHKDKQAKDFCASLEENFNKSCLSVVSEYYKSF